MFKNLTNNIGKHTEAFLQQQGVDVALIRRAVAADVNYNDRLRVEVFYSVIISLITFQRHFLNNWKKYALLNLHKAKRFWLRYQIWPRKASRILRLTFSPRSS